MLEFLTRRILLLVPTVFVISMIAFVVIQLPPGDFLTSYVATLQAAGENVDEAQIESLRQQYGLGEPIHVQYLKWMAAMTHGNFGQSLQWKAPVKDLIWERLVLTVVLSLTSLIFIWAVAFPVGVYSAIKQYSPGDYFFTVV